MQVSWGLRVYHHENTHILRNSQPYRDWIVQGKDIWENNHVLGISYSIRYMWIDVLALYTYVSMNVSSEKSLKLSSSISKYNLAGLI